MELKRILARDSRSANEKAIQLYGNDVLIISSQRLDNQIELIVATDVDPAVSPDADASLPNAASSSHPKAQMPFVPFSQLLDEVNSEQEIGVSEDGLQEHQKNQTSSTAVSALPPVTNGERLNSAHESQRSLEIVDMLRQEMASLRKEFTLSRQMQPWQDGLRLSPDIQPLMQAMNEMGVPAALRALLTDSIQPLHSKDEAMEVMQRLLVTSLMRPDYELQPAVAHALCGPSGSGKTSMVGRLALASAQKLGPEKQAMVSFADHRPGAWAQMQLLASQSGVDCFRVSDAAMLNTLLEDLQGKTVWIDTCGVDFGAQAAQLHLHCPQVFRHAVLPVDATVTSVRKILQKSAIPWASLMLSKMDEAAHPWALLQGLTENSLPVSGVAGDSRISTQAHGFDPAQLVALALSPMMPLSGLSTVNESVPTVLAVQPKRPVAHKKPVVAAPYTVPISDVAAAVATKPKVRAKVQVKPVVSDEIEIPTLMGPSVSTRSPVRSKPSPSA
jgi:flagellar biosynthesis protein FlhF